MLTSRMLPRLLLFNVIAMLASYILYNIQDDNNSIFTGHNRMMEEDTPLLQNILLRQQRQKANSKSSINNYLLGGVDGVHYNHVQHNHTIPNVLVFTHYKNLLDLDLSQNPVNATTAAKEEHDELRALQASVLSIIALHPNATTRFLTDVDCETSIRNALGPDTKLVEYFSAESHGMYKSDICRGAALWETGGLYFDVDLGARLSLWTAVGQYTSFVTVKVPVHSKQRPGFFQAFMGSTPQHPLLQRYLELFVQYYEGKLLLKTKVLPNPDKHMLGVRILRIAYDQLVKQEEETTTNYSHQPIILPKDGATSPAATTTATSSNTLGIVELWQETLYSPRAFPLIHKPTWGVKNKSCRYVVVANDGLWPPLVPFYSRIAGSRMCPITA